MNQTAPTLLKSRAITFGAAFVRSAHYRGDAEALVIASERRSYAELLQRALARASALHEVGIKRGDHVGILMENSIEYIELFLGAILLGAVPVLFSDITRSYYLGMRLPSLHLKAFFVSASERADFAGVVEEAVEIAARENCDKPQLWGFGFAGADFQSYDSFLAMAKPDSYDAILQNVEAMQPDDPLLVVFTAGLTGVPKTCRLTHQNLLGKADSFVKRFELMPHSRLWMPTPMFQIGFVQPLIAALTAGASVVAMTHFDPLDALKVLQHERITHAYPIYLGYWLPIIHQLEFRPAHFVALSHMVLVGPTTVLKRIQRALPQCVVMNTYGSAEEGGAFCLPRGIDPAKVRLGSSGRPYPGHQVRIVDPVSGAACKTGELGEIQVRGSGVPNPAMQDEFGSQFTDDGWLKTSDLGLLNVDGALFFHGRVAEMLSIDGTNVSALTIESVLSDHPAVSVAQVIGVVDVDLGQVASAFIELRPGHATKPVELMEFCRKHLPLNAVPRYITFVNEWPTTASKIFKPALAELTLGPRLLP